MKSAQSKQQLCRMKNQKTEIYVTAAPLKNFNRETIIKKLANFGKERERNQSFFETICKDPICMDLSKPYSI